MITIRLSKQDEHASILKGNDTVAVCRALGYKPRSEKMGKFTREQGTIQGFRTEYAVARLFNISPPQVNIESDGGIDMWVNDTSVDVKTTMLDQPMLIFDSEDRFQADVAVLTKVSDQPEIEILGWMAKKHFLGRALKKDFGYGERLVVAAADLYPIETLWLNFQKKLFSNN